MSELMDWLREQLAEDERAALAAEQGEVGNGRWWAVEDRHYDDGLIRNVRCDNPHDPDDPDPTYYIGGGWVVTGEHYEPDAVEQATLRHIARWDPARVLAEVKAKRAVLLRAENAIRLSDEYEDSDRIGGVAHKPTKRYSSASPTAGLIAPASGMSGG